AATRNGSKECSAGANPTPTQTATPVAPPSWSAARCTPEAIPASSSVTPLTATYCSPTRPNAIPAAIRSMAGTIAAAPAPTAETSAITPIAAAVYPRPASTHTRAPQRPNSRGTSTENAISDTASGSINRPAPSGPTPERSCRWKVNSRNDVDNPPLSSIVVTFAVTRVRWARNRSGSSGLRARASTRTNPAPAATAPARAATTTHAGVPGSPASTTPNVSSSGQAVSSSAPGRSSGGASSANGRSRSTRRTAATITTRTNGTETRKIHRHPTCAVRNPDRTNPSTSPQLATAAHTPNARVRRGPSGNVRTTTAIAAGSAIASPAPC